MGAKPAPQEMTLHTKYTTSDGSEPYNQGTVADHTNSTGSSESSIQAVPAINASVSQVTTALESSTSTTNTSVPVSVSTSSQKQTTVSSNGTQPVSTVTVCTCVNVTDVATVTTQHKGTNQPPASTGLLKEEHVYAITGVSVGLVLLVCFFLVLFLPRKWRRQTELNTKAQPTEPKVKTGDTTHVVTHRHLSRNDDYCEIDLADNDSDTRMPRYSDHDRQDAVCANSHSIIQPRASRSKKNPKSNLVCLKSIRLMNDSVQPEDGTGKESEKNVYFILEPRKPGADDDEFAVPNSVSCVDESTRETSLSCPDIKVVHSSESGITGTTTQQKTNSLKRSRQMPSERTINHDSYEVMDFDVSKKSACRQQLKANGGTAMFGQIEDGSPVEQTDEASTKSWVTLEGPDDDELIMVDNIVYESADGIIPGGGQTASSKFSLTSESPDDDELIMIDNIVYESADGIFRGTGHAAAVVDNNDELTQKTI